MKVVHNVFMCLLSFLSVYTLAYLPIYASMCKLYIMYLSVQSSPPTHLPTSFRVQGLWALRVLITVLCNVMSFRLEDMFCEVNCVTTQKSVILNLHSVLFILGVCILLRV
jgi:hypothetical protein